MRTTYTSDSGADPGPLTTMVVRDLDQVDGAFGEAFAGESPDGVHINLVVGRRGGPTAAAAAAALMAPSPGHVPFLACLHLGAAVRPPTVVVNKTTIEGDKLGRLTWGAAQLGIAQAVLDAVADRAIDHSVADDLVLLVGVWLDADAADETAVRIAARGCMRQAIDRAIDSDRPTLDELAAERENAHNGFYSGR